MSTSDYLEHGGHGRTGFTSHGGGIHQTAILGQAPESRSHGLDKRCWPVRVHNTARIEAYVTVDAGTFRPTTIGPRTWLMKACHVAHDVVIGEDCEITPRCVIAGEVTIGDRVQVKIGALIRPQVTIGDDALIGMGAVVVSDVPAGAVVVGNPARILRFKDGFDEATQAAAIRAAEGIEPQTA